MTIKKLTPRKIFTKAIKNNDLKTVKELVESKKVKPEAYGDSAIYQASQKGFYQIVEYLLQQEQVSQDTCGLYCIHEAVRAYHFKTLEALLQDKLEYTEKHNFVRAIKVLLSHESDSQHYHKLFKSFFSSAIWS